MTRMLNICVSRNILHGLEKDNLFCNPTTSYTYSSKRVTQRIRVYSTHQYFQNNQCDLD